MLVPPSYNSNLMIQSTEATFQRQQPQPQPPQPPSYQSSVIAKNIKHAAIKSQQVQSNKMVYGKPMETVYRNYQTPLQDMSSGIQDVEDDTLRSK